MSEAEELKRAGARAHFNSGRGRVKGDGSTDRYVIDVKEFKKSFSVSKEVWAKICTDTIRVDPEKEPVIMLKLGDTKPIRLAIIAWSEFERLKELDG